MFLILALCSIYIVGYQNVSATGDEIVSSIIKIDSNTPNGPVLSHNDQFGYSIAYIGNQSDIDISYIAVGARNDDIGGSDRGAIHVMFMNSDGTVSRTIEINSNSTNGPNLADNDNFGYSIANIGDLNGYGVFDIAVGATGDDGTSSNQNSGAIHVMFMNSDGTVSRTIEINSTSTTGLNLVGADNFGYSIANIGDLNGDGISDIAVGAAGDRNYGAIHVLFMNSNGTVSRSLELGRNTNNLDLFEQSTFGSSIANIGDLNGDGVSDIAVGATGFNNADSTTSGAIHIIFMNSNGTVSNSIRITNNTINGPVWSSLDNFGTSIANIGDLNGDGITDIAVGAYFDDTGGSNRGTIHVLLMNSNGTVSRTIEINSNSTNGPNLADGDAFGASIANIGDLNNDGISDIAVGAVSDNSIHVIFLNSLDKTPPTITSITSDATFPGTLKVGDTISFTLTTNSTENAASINSTFNSVELSWSTADNRNTYTATYTVSEGDADQTTLLQITDVTITDSAGNTSLPFNGTDILKTIDANSPKFSSAQTLSIVQIAITLDQNVNASSAIPNDFTLGGVIGGSIDSIVSVSNNIITLGITGATISDSDDDVTISYVRTSGSFDDVSGNSLLNFAENVTNTLDTPPIITLNGDNPQIIELGVDYTELGATTNDGSQVTINAAEFTDKVGTYSIYYDSVDASGNSATQVIRTVNVIEATIPTFCTVSSSGDWIITTSCTLDSSATATRNVIVQNDSILSIPSGITLDIDFANNNLTVETGSGVLIKFGGTIT